MAFIGGKKKQEAAEQALISILDAQDADVLVVRGAECKLLFINESARGRLGQDTKQPATCMEGYTHLFRGLCDKCMSGAPETSDAPSEEAFEVKNTDGAPFQGYCRQVTWLDGKPATALFLHDTSEQQQAQERLYSLAYIDSLTGVPNRQRFREDFEAVAADITAGRKSGIVAIFDMDNFKAVNDTYGHNTGDIMLRRLTEHLSTEPAYKEHLYRLGGDEFVLFYVDAKERFASDEELHSHYSNLLQDAFLAYTMPNIEISCTISMGVAFFPAHGVTVSELLRKADIALYKAKAEGRDRLVLFEDKYDNAKKFKDLYINIQPILTQQGRTFGYELVDRGNEGKDDGEMNLAGFDRTMDALGLGEMDNDAKYFIVYSSQLLSGAVRNNLPRDKFIIEVNATGIDEKEMKKYRELRGYGYSLCLAGLPAEAASPTLMEMADYCKLAPGVDGHTQKQLIAKYPVKRFIATDVNTGAEFENAQRKGFKLFQGYFFNQPVVVKKTKDIDPMKVNYLRLLKLTSVEGYSNFKEISAVISSDVALSYKLLRLLNSAAVGLRNKVSSIDMALAYLGEEHLKKWIALLALRGVADDKPLELVRLSLIRAQFGELLAPHFVPRRDTRHVFMVGLFSLLHIALEKTQAEMFEDIPVADDIRESLMGDNGIHSDLVRFYVNYEYANWDEVSQFSRDNRLSDQLVNEAYIAAVKWYNDLAEETN